MLKFKRKFRRQRVNNLYCSLNVSRVTKSRITRWVVHVARMGDRNISYKVLVINPEGGKDHLEDLEIDGSII